MKKLFLSILFFTLAIVRADDLCYDTPYSGFYGFMNVKDVVPIRYIGNGDALNGVKIEYAISGFDLVSFNQDIGINDDTFTKAAGDDAAELTAAISIDFGYGMPDLSLFDKGITYYLGGYGTGSTDEIWTGEFFITAFLDNFFTTTRIYADYTKGGEDYHVIVNPCPGSSSSVPAVAVNDSSMDAPLVKTAMTFTVDVSGALSGDITDATAVSYVHYYTQNGTAEAGVDYEAVDNTVIIPAGATTATIDVNIYPNSSGYFYLILDNAYAAIISDGNATGTIKGAFELCYANSTGDNVGNGKCVKAGSSDFYSATQKSPHDCNTEVTIRNINAQDALGSVEVKKLYKPLADAGSCSTAQGSCYGLSAASVPGYTDYQSGYTYELGTVGANSQTLIYDHDTYYSAADLSDIILYGRYEKDGLVYSGEVPSCGGGGGGIINSEDFMASVDVVDDFSYLDPTYSPWIQTKTSNKDGYVVKAVYLGTGADATNLPQLYNPAVANKNQSSSLTILLKVADFSAEGATCQTAPFVDLFSTVGGSTPVVAVIDAKEMSAPTNSFVMAYEDGGTLYAKKDVRFKYKAIDFNKLIIDSGIQCAQKSSTGGVVEGIPACMIANPNDNKEIQNTAIENYKTVFGEDAYHDCYTENGQPCWASNGGVGLPPYDHAYGCFECSIGAMPYVCSQDNFAIRPDKFVIDSTSDSYPDLLRAGEGYDLEINAVHYGTTTNAMGYNQTGNNLTIDEPTRWYSNNTEANTLTMKGDANWISSDFNLTDGAVSSGTPTFAFSDVGRITLLLEDRNWAAVDIDNANDPTPEECAANGAYICSDRNVTFIPDHFDVNVTALHNNSASNKFTYLSNDMNMSARFDVIITAENALGATTQNFTATMYGHALYENPVTVLLDVPNDTPLGTAKKQEITTATLLGFLDGSKTIGWNDANESMRLLFNYLRRTNTPVNPVKIIGSQTRVDVNSTYTATEAPEGVAYIDGSGNADGNVTYVYGRIHAPRYRAMCDGGSCSGNVTYFYEFYADKDANPTLITELLGTNKRRSIDSVNWYRNSLHNTATDGNVSFTTSNIPGALEQTSFTHATQTSSTSYIYEGSNGYPYKGTITIPQSKTAGAPSWLIYDKYRPDSNTTSAQGEVEYYGPGTWTSTGDFDTKSISDTDKAKKNTNRRIRW